MPAMIGWLKNIFLDEKARKAVAKPKAGPAKAAASKAASASKPKAPAMTPEREKLLKDAAAQVRRAKQAVMADLDDESRAKLVAMAITAFLNESDKKKQ
jgi:hypothetical protein